MKNHDVPTDSDHFVLGKTIINIDNANSTAAEAIAFKRLHRRRRRTGAVLVS
jgi:hypothetical protein